MNIFLVIFIVFASLYCSISWLLPKLLAWLFKRKYHIELQIGRIAVPKLVLKDVNLTKNGYSIHIDEITFRSSFFNSEINKVLYVIVKDVRIDNNVEEKRSVVVETILKPLLSKQNSRTEANITQQADVHDCINQMSPQKLLDFRNQKLPHGLVMFAQFMGVHISNISVMVLRGSSTEEGWLLHATAAELHLDGSTGGAPRTLLFTASLQDGSAKLLPRKKHICLGEISCGLLLEGTVRADGPISVEKLTAGLISPTVSVHEACYSYMQDSGYSKPRRRIVTDDQFVDIIPRFSPLIPKIFSLRIDTTTLSGVHDNTTTDFQASLHSLQINSRFSAGGELPDRPAVPQVYVAFQMDQLTVNTSKEKILFLNKLKLDAKLEKGVLNLYLIISVISIIYNHEEVYNWFASNFHKKRNPLQVEKPKETSGMPAWAARALSLCVVQGCVETRAVSVLAALRGRALALACQALKLKLDQLHDTRGSAYEWALGRAMLGRRHWSAELLADCVWARALPAAGAGAGAGGSGGAGAGDASPHKRHHQWGDAFYLAVALLKWGSQHNSPDTKLEAMMDCLRVEWSEAVSSTVSAAVRCAQDYCGVATASRADVAAPISVDVTVALSHVNAYVVLDAKMCVMGRVDAVTVEAGGGKAGAVVSGLKLVDMVPYTGLCASQRADDILLSFFYVKLARIEYLKPTQEQSAYLDLQFLENADLEWSPNLHLKMLTIVRTLKAFKNELRGAPKDDIRDEGKAALNWCVTFKGDTNLGLSLEHNHLLFTTDDLTVSMDAAQGLSIAWSALRLILNGTEIVTVDGFSMERLHHDAALRAERIANEDFLLDWNKAWGVTIDSVRVVFPYKHRWSEAIQGELVSAFKWLKATHGIVRKPFTHLSPLPSDLLIKVEEFVVEMSDDPFEVKLRDNYELLEDEYKESEKRRNMLDAKVAELCKPPLFVPAGKIDELYAALRLKDGQIYVKRSRAAPPPRTRLIACALSRTTLMALADPATHGTTQATRLMRDIDHDSPWPEDGLEFSTLWCRGVSMSCAEWQLLLRDFPQPLLRARSLRLWGTLLGAEQLPPPRALRSVTIEQGEPWGPYRLERSMMPLKFYYDLCCEMDSFSYAFGPCWEPVIAQCNLAFDQVSRPSLDPSPPLAWWDKVRLLMHGRLTAKFNRFTCLLHVSLDPYNTTEEMELTWADLALDWTNGKLVFGGELKVFVRTASKYDDCRVVWVPALRLAVKLLWRCAADASDHHAVAPCAPHRLPEYSSNQEHDSYRAFRSQGLDLHLSLETKPSEAAGAQLLLYASTLRWFESLKMILSGVTRPTRRGKVFRNVRPRKLQLSRHYRTISVSLTLHDFQVVYWSSSSMQRGAELNGVRVTLGSEHSLALVPFADGLVRRPRAQWSIVYMNCDLNDAEIWLKSAAPNQQPPDEASDTASTASLGLNSPVEKCYWLSVGRVSYGRAASGVGGSGPQPLHRLAVHDLRGAWTKINRDVAFALFDQYVKNQQLKKNLSTKAFKEEETTNTSPKHQRETEMVSPPPSGGLQGLSPGWRAEGMLAALVAGAGGGAGGAAPVVFSEEVGEEPAPPAPPPIVHAPLTDDTYHTTWLIELVNSQVVLKGCETRGYVILCAARAEVRQRVRRSPAAVAWAAQLSAMQYYATVSAQPHASETPHPQTQPDHLDENIQWVSVEEIEDRRGSEISSVADVPRLVGSGHSAGGVIGSTVGPSDDTTTTQLQRIVSRCACELYYISQEEAGGVQWQAGAEGAPWLQQPQPYDAFTLMHHSLDVCTNSLQYAMLLDVVNNLVLHVEEERRRTLERRARMRFQLHLHHHTDPRKLIQRTQNQVRESLARLRRLEKEYYLKRRALAETNTPGNEELQLLDAQVNECKESVWAVGEELDAMVWAVRETRERGGRAPLPPAAPPAAAPPHRRNEICFRSARWRLTDADGQLGIADLLLTNFLYTKTSRSDESVEHNLEVGGIRVTNLLPREPFPEVLAPQEVSGSAPVRRRAALRVFCRDRPPVGGISVKEHFEVNIIPIRIGLTKKFFNTMLKFCFPERGEEDEGEEEEGRGSTGSLAPHKRARRKPKDSSFYVKIEKDDVEKMKERAEKNKLFIYIKIPEVPVRVSYKGGKEKNLEDARDLPLVVPTLEYHNVTWTWLDLLMAIKSDTRRVILSQAIRQKLQLHRRSAAPPPPQEDDKARLLLGDITVNENKPQKKGGPNVFKFSKS